MADTEVVIIEEKESAKKPTEATGAFTRPNNGPRPMSPRRSFKAKKKYCALCQRGILSVDYKDIDLLKHYVDFDHTGKILSHYITGACPRHQRQVSNAIHRARIVALLPFIKKDN